MRRLHAVATVLWGLLVPPSLIWWRESVPYLVFLSVYAVLVGHWSSWQAAKAEAEPSLTREDLAALRRVLRP